MVTFESDGSLTFRVYLPHAECVELVADSFGSTELLVPHDRYDVIARLHESGEIQEQEQIDGAVRIKGRYPPSQAGFFAPFVVVR